MERKPDTLPKLTKKLDAVFSRWVRLSAVEDDGLVSCFTCNYRAEPKKLQCGHYISRQHRSCRWEEWNCRPQCYVDNVHYGGKPQTFRERLCETYGEEQVKEYEQQRHLVKQWTRDELREMIEDYKAKVAKLESLW